MNLKNIPKNALFFLLLHCASSLSQIITEVDVPELQLLASNLKPEECVRLVSLDSQSSLSDAQIQKLAEEQSCFRRLVKWICQLRTVTRNTYPILNDLLERIGRKDLIACLSELNMKSSKSSKVARDVQSAEDSEEDPVTTTISTQPGTGNDATVSTPSTKNSNQTIDRLSGYTIKISLKTGGIVLITTILLTCCCTLFIRHRIASVFNRIFGRSKKKTKTKKRGKYIAIDADEPGDVSRSYLIRKARPKRKREPSYELVDMGTQNTIAVVPKEPEEPSPTGCYKCYKKKRKKRPYR